MIKSLKNSPDIIEEVELDYTLRMLISRWKLLLVISLVCAVTSFIATRMLPKQYEAKATIYVQGSSFASSLMRDLPININQSSSSSSGYIVTLLQSDAMRRDVISTLHLKSNPAYAKGGTKRVDEVLSDLRKSIFIDQDKNGGINIIVRAANPLLAANMANRMLDNLGSLVVTNSKDKVAFISHKLDDTDKRLQRTEDELLGFQQHNKIASIDQETRDMLDKLNQLDGRLVSVNMDLQQTGSELVNEGDMNSLIALEVRKKSLQSSKAYLTKEINKLQGRIGNYPSFAMRYLRLQRRIGVLSKTFDLLNEQLQLANISQHGENGDYQVVDRARPIHKPVLPKLALNTAIGGLLGVVIPAGIMVLFGKPGRVCKAKY